MNFAKRWHQSILIDISINNHTIMSYVKSSTSYMGNVENFTKLILEECKKREITNDPTEPGIWKLIFPPQFISVFAGIEIIKRVVKIEISIKYDNPLHKYKTFRTDHTLEFLMYYNDELMPSFVCGCVDHGKDMKQWRAL